MFNYLLLPLPFFLSSHGLFSKGILGKQELLEGPQGLENARYGSAITDVSDIDLDGFNDVIVGAPLENENVGAIYIYNGKQRTIHTKYSQVSNFVVEFN